METMQKMKPKLMKVECEPSCGFMIRSHDKKELISMVKSHAKHSHNKSIKDNDVEDMIMMA